MLGYIKFILTKAGVSLTAVGRIARVAQKAHTCPSDRARCVSLSARTPRANRICAGVSSSTKGTTLVEMMVAVGIFFLVIGVIFSITGTSMMSWNIAHTRIFLQTQARNALNCITEDLLWSTRSRIFIGGGGTTISFNIPVVNPVDDGLVTTPGGGVLWGDGVTSNNYIDYRVNNGNLIRQTLSSAFAPIAGTQRIIAQRVTNFNVALNGLRYTITLTFTMNNFGGAPLPTPVVYTVTTGFIPRN